MHPYVTGKFAEAHRDDLLREADMERLASRIRSSLHRARGSHVVVRVLQPSDRSEIARLFERLSVRSRYLRYLAPVRSLSQSSLQDLADIDHAQHEAVGAFAEGALIGAAHYVVTTDDPHAAEISVEVADSHQREGVATRLLDVLAGNARARGITRFTATALKQNAAVLPLARRLGWPVGVQTRGHELVLGLCFNDV